jgi:hypothetical protein
LATPRGLSQPPTSFIGSWCQGIHHALLVAWPQRCSRPLCSSQTTNNPTTNPHLTSTPKHQFRPNRGFVEQQARHPEETADPPTPNTHAGSKIRGAWVRSLRTQQDVHEPHPPTPTPVPHPPCRNRASSTREARVNQKGSQARFHINEPHPLDTNGRARMQTWTPNTPSRMSTASGSLERR